jgi:hypothetical protein
VSITNNNKIFIPMKTFFLQSALFACGLLLSVSCSKDNEIPIGEEELDLKNASLTITVSGSESKDVGGLKFDTRALGTPSQAEENKIFNYLIYVFYTNGSLEKIDTVDNGTLTKTVTGLMAGTKKVVILANAPANFPTIVNYNDLDTTKFNLDTQDPSNLSTSGLTMSGEETKTLISGTTNTLSIPVYRVVAKIKLGGITINASPGHDPAKFELVAAHIMKARGRSTMGIPSISTDDIFYGGLVGTVSTTNKSYLTQTITAGNENCYFYVFPNDNTSDNATLFTIEGKYDDVTKYFSFCINDKIINPDDGTGDYIKRNTVHTINVTIKKPGGGTIDPEQQADLTDLDITIVPQDWTVIPEQPAEW